MTGISRFRVVLRERKVRNSEGAVDRFWVILDRKHRNFICASICASYPSAQVRISDYCKVLNDTCSREP